MQIEEGKFYRARDGRKVGPMRKSSFDDGYPWHADGVQGYWSNTGVRQRSGCTKTDLIAEWTDKPAEPKLWRDMTPKEKGALFLAAHEGKVIEASSDAKLWLSSEPQWREHYYYRVRPEPVRETITARVCIMKDGTSLHMEPGGHVGKYSDIADHYAQLTFNVVDGKPDYANARVEPIE